MGHGPRQVAPSSFLHRLPHHLPILPPHTILPTVSPHHLPRWQVTCRGLPKCGWQYAKTNATADKTWSKIHLRNHKTTTWPTIAPNVMFLLDESHPSWYDRTKLGAPGTYGGRAWHGTTMGYHKEKRGFDARVHYTNPK